MPNANEFRPDGKLCLVWVIGMLVPFAGIDAQETSDRNELHNPVHRVAKRPEAKLEKGLTESETTPVRQVSETSHPLDQAISIAKKTLDYIDSNVRDYSCIMVKRERINGTLLDHEFMKCKIRHEQVDQGEMSPFSVYLGFRKPDAVKGREVLFVKGQNAGKLVAHEGGLRGRLIPTVELPTDSVLAMRNNKYPITEIGIRTLTQRLIEKGERDKKIGTCSVRVLKGAKVKDRVCTCIEVKHHQRKPGYDFHLARIFLDDELQVPIRYEAFGWPSGSDGTPPLLEEYTYINMKINVGLTMNDFDRENPNYNF